MDCHSCLLQRLRLYCTSCLLKSVEDSRVDCKQDCAEICCTVSVSFLPIFNSLNPAYDLRDLDGSLGSPKGPNLSVELFFLYVLCKSPCNSL